MGLTFAFLLIAASVVTTKPISHGPKGMVRSDLGSIEQSVRLFRLNTGRWPTSVEELLTPPHDVLDRWQGPYLEEEPPLDPWGNPYRLYPGDPPVLMCLGADGLAGGRDEAADTVRLVSGVQAGQY